MDNAKIPVIYKFLIINTDTNACFIVKSTRNISDLLKNKFDVNISHMFFYRFFNSHNNNFVIKGPFIIKKLLWNV